MTQSYKLCLLSYLFSFRNCCGNDARTKSLYISNPSFLTPFFLMSSFLKSFFTLKNVKLCCEKILCLLFVCTYSRPAVERKDQ